MHMTRLTPMNFVIAAQTARADVAPDPTDPTTPAGGLIYLGTAIVFCAFALILWRRRR